MSQIQQPQYVGVFVRKAATPAALSVGMKEIAQHRRFDLKEATEDSAALATLIPEAILAESSVWLIAHHRDNERNIIVLPIAPELQEMTNTPSSNSRMSAFLEAVGAACENIRADDLRRAAPRESRGFQPLAPYVECWEVLRLPRPFGQLRKELPIKNPHSKIDVRRQASQVIDESARATEADRNQLRQHIGNDTAGDAEDARREFDEKLLDRNSAIALSIKSEFGWEQPDLDLILGDLRSLLDPQSIAFLQSSLMVDDFANRVRYPDFDYAIPGSGFWKTIELELNLSVVWLIRLVLQVAETSGPLVPNLQKQPGTTKLQTGPPHALHKDVAIDRRSKNQSHQLGKLMLGDVRHILSNADVNGLRAQVQKSGFGDLSEPGDADRFLFGRGQLCLPSTIGDVAELRNNHAHTERMNLEAYNEIKLLVLGMQNGFANSLLASILRFKQHVHEFAACNMAINS